MVRVAKGDIGAAAATAVFVAIIGLVRLFQYLFGVSRPVSAARHGVSKRRRKRILTSIIQSVYETFGLTLFFWGRLVHHSESMYTCRFVGAIFEKHKTRPKCFCEILAYKLKDFFRILVVISWRFGVTICSYENTPTSYPGILATK